MSQHLGEFEQLLLFALLDLRAEADGTAIRRRIEQRTGRVVAPGAIYTAMDRLGSRSFVASAVRVDGNDGRRRRYYRLEPSGARALERSFRTLTRMSEGLGKRLTALATESRRR